MMGDDTAPVVHGIDFGTSTSLIMIGRPGQPHLLIRDPAAASGEQGFPTSVCVRGNGSLAIGHEAERIKRLRIRDYRTGFKLEIGEPVNHRLGLVDYSPDQLMAEVIRFLRERALAVVPTEPDIVVVTVPVAWEQWTQGLAVRACSTAGYDAARIRLRTEPVAALTSVATVGTTLVYDLGGGTFDCAVALDSGSGPQIFGSAFGLPRVGGRAFDNRIFRHVREIFPQTEKIFTASTDDSDALRSRIQLREKCVQAKIGLSVTEVHEDLLSEIDPPELFELARTELFYLIEDLVEETVDECERMLRSLDLSWADVDRCVLVGGSSRLQLVKQRMHDRSGRPVTVQEEPELAVVRGATALALDIALPPAATQQGSPAIHEPPSPVFTEPDNEHESIELNEVEPLRHTDGLRVFEPDRNLFHEM